MRANHNAGENILSHSVKRLLLRCDLVASALLCLAGGLLCFPARAQIDLPALFGDHMVLQREMPIPVWGTAAPNSGLQVSLAGQTVSTTADAAGAWSADLPPMPAGGPYELVIMGTERRVLSDIMIGDVWLCSGQSNMAWPVKSGALQVKNAEQEVAAATWPGIRMLTVRREGSPIVREDIATEGWQVCSPDTVGAFSATGYFFARAIHQHTRVPIGMLNSSVGGTMAEAWTSKEGLQTLPEFGTLLDEIDRDPTRIQAIAERFDEEMAAWKQAVDDADAGYVDGKARWARPEFDDSDWAAITLPTYWEDAGYPELDGLMWHRRTVTIPESWAGKELRIRVGSVNDRLRMWLNGEEIVKWAANAQCETGFPIPAGLVQAGPATIAARVYDMGNKGGLYGDPDNFWIRADGESISLAGPWQCRPGTHGQKFPEIPRPPLMHPDNPNAPSRLFNAMIAPLTRVPIRGAIWYQGESNERRAYAYRGLFPTLIRDWRAHWGRGDFPFLFVQLPNYRARRQEPGEANWAEMREAQAMALALPNTGMAITVDLGEADNIHPANKQDVGARLALVARHVAYDEDLAYSGPLFRGAAIEGERIRIQFDHVGRGLVAKGGEPLRGFAIAGKDREFRWAQAEIDGDSVVVWRNDIARPVAVRYAWADNPDCNLHNAAGLPASPFRTDEWPGITFGEKLRIE